ncbi:MAG: hypothetical protein COB34_03630 [Methylophilaceae bacterium]|nr:MAG: hypothetical protein COB34_03630 [Methylophilaceae bacterium]
MSSPMQRNYKLKHAVTAALSLLAFGFHHSSHAIGLSEINVQSHLGQPLKSTVNVLGAGDLKGTSCLSLGPNSDLSHVNFILGPLSGDIAKLTITSNKIINEPIVNLSIVAGCDTSIKRDYVLLLDPPLGIQAEIAQFNKTDATVIAYKIDTSVETSAIDLTPPVQKPKAKTKAKVNLKKKALSSKKAIVKSYQKPKSLAKKSKEVTQAELVKSTKIQAVARPRLSISGGSKAMTHANTIGLRLDKQLSFTPNPNTAVMSENIVVEDEVTAMNKRLAHLQQQITTLQKQNLTLVSENKLHLAQLTQTDSSSTKLSSILPYLGTGLLLITGYFAFHWFRRRQLILQNHNAEAIWVNTDTKAKDEKTNESSSADGEDIFADLSFGIEDSVEDKKLSPASMTENFEATKTEEQAIVLEDEQQFSVLDHADVFLSHGRSTLAIQLLQNHLLEHPKQSVTIWLFLLDLLTRDNLKSLYEQTTQDCKLHYNVKISAFSKPETTASESLEDFPHLAQGLQSVWNTPAAIVYLDDLIYNNRLEPRAGLAKNLIEELVLLRSMAQENVNSAEVIHLDEKKLAMRAQKEALLETRKAEKLKEIAEAEKLAQEKALAESNETIFEFTLVENK